MNSNFFFKKNLKIQIKIAKINHYCVCENRTKWSRSYH